MDFAIVASVLTALLGAIPGVAVYFQRQTRRTRTENRLLRSIVQEGDLHMFALERQLTARGVRPPSRPELLRAVGGDDGPDNASARRPDDPAGRGSRHAQA